MEHASVLDEPIEVIDQAGVEEEEEETSEEEDVNPRLKAKSAYIALAVNVLKESTRYEPNNPADDYEEEYEGEEDDK